MPLIAKPKPARIVHLITSLHVGGAQMHLYKTLTRFDPAKFATTVVSLVPPGKVGEMLSRAGIPVLSLGMAKGQPSPLALLKLYRLLRRLKPHLLQTHLYHADLMGFLAGKLARVPVLFWNIRQSAMEFSRYRPTTGLTVKICARLSRRLDKILVNSSAGLAHHAALGYDRAQMVVVPNGFETERFRPDPFSYRAVRKGLGLPPTARLVGLMARLDPQKDHENFFQAARLVAEQAPEAFFLLAGQGVTPANPEVANLIRVSGLSPSRLFLLGERHDMPRLTAALDVAVSASAFGEGFANTVGEAMACGVPCVVTDVGDSAAIVGKSGLVVPPRDPARLAQAILDLLALEPEDYRQKGAAARERLMANFNLDLIVKRLEALYLDAVNLEKPAAPEALAPAASGR